MRVLITGAFGFLGRNLQIHLLERSDVEVVLFGRESDENALPGLVENSDFVFHFAGINRPLDSSEFIAGNSVLTQRLCEAVRASGRAIPIVYTSSIQAKLDNPYGVSKRAAEQHLFALQSTHGVPVYVFRLPNVFGKWCRPNYNSAVATFCFNVARGLPITVNDPNAHITLVYVDDIMQRFIGIMDGMESNAIQEGFALIEPQYTITVGNLADTIQAFKDSRSTLVTARVGAGLVRALYSTYVSYLPLECFSYQIPQYSDPRGVFVEMLKTPDCGQFSYFTAHPGITRGGHYHHSKTEKFLVIKGLAHFRFRNMHTGETFDLVTSGDKAEIVETVPGWTHDITNIGSDEMVVMLWANEIFDRSKPDTFACPLGGGE